MPDTPTPPRRSGRRLAALLAPLLVGACAVGPDYTAPVTPPRAAGDFVTTDARFDAAAPLPDDWWHLYKDPVLDALVEQALAANTDLRVANANLARAQAVLSESRAARLPTTNLNGGLSWGDAVQFGGAGQGGGSGQGGGFANLGETQVTTNANASLAWEADLFGRVSRSIEAARADAAAIEAARDGVRVLVAAETTRAYLQACTQAQGLEVARQSVETTRRTLELTQALERAGSVGKADVERAGSAHASARAAIPTIEAGRRVALFELAALLGQTPDSVPQAARSCSAPPSPGAALPVGDGAALLRRRPDLREAERNLAAETARIGVATADLYPRISLGGSGNFLRNDMIKGSDSFSFGLGPLISWTFPDFGAAHARIRQAEAQTDVALAQFDGQVLTALKEVEQGLSRVAGGEAQMADLDEAETRAERAWQLTQQRQRAGSSSALDVLAAQADLLAARRAVVEARAQLASDRVDLFKALGGGWQTPPAS
ncbi:efflux transporter outer membrane subunit [Novosphingobium decolorationis]|uniref:TolC family protein n=1 Tax=Novosphingobium decolorationis TaxID=2698673 RepID=A0ABX8E9C0_9SPHN|nr:TolC family protein [Novosphingobium decolorationis]QVM85619.1 TolC family protein [Novosphingobium decolorationis]